VEARHPLCCLRSGGLEDERDMLPPDSAEERRRTISNLHAGPLVLQVSVYCLHPKEEIAAPAS